MNRTSDVECPRGRNFLVRHHPSLPQILLILEDTIENPANAMLGATGTQAVDSVIDSIEKCLYAEECDSKNCIVANNYPLKL